MKITVEEGPKWPCVLKLFYLNAQYGPSAKRVKVSSKSTSLDDKKTIPKMGHWKPLSTDSVSQCQINESTKYVTSDFFMMISEEGSMGPLGSTDHWFS